MAIPIRARATIEITVHVALVLESAAGPAVGPEEPMGGGGVVQMILVDKMYLPRSSVLEDL